MPTAPDFKSDFLRTFVARGAFYACSEPAAELDALFQKERVTAYIGFDCTADSLHVGSLLQIMILRLLQKHGHKPVVLMGHCDTVFPQGTAAGSNTNTVISSEVRASLRDAAPRFETPKPATPPAAAAAAGSAPAGPPG